MDNIGNMLGGLTRSPQDGAGDIAGAIGGLVGGPGGLKGVVDQLTKGGMGDVVASWIGSEPNKHVDPKALGEALGAEKVSEAAGKAGLSVEAFLPILAAALPTVIDAVTPDGKVSDGDAVGGLDIGGMLQGLTEAASAGPDSPLSMLGGLLGGNKG